MLTLSILILAFLILASLLGLLFPVAGTWERMSNGNQSIWDRERVILKQWGCYVFGKHNISGGLQKFSGFAFGPWAFLKRKDYGIQGLVHQGFPENIAPLVEGRVLLRLSLKLSSDKLFLEGHATPFKVEFYEDGSGIKSIHSVDPTPRKYRRAELTPIEEPTLTTVGKPAYDV